MTRKKTSLNTLGGQIRVLLVDDDTLARKAWTKVLDSSRQIHVISEVSLAELKKFMSTHEPPEIIVAGYSFMEAGFLRSSTLQSFWTIHPKVILILENKDQVIAAFKNGAEFALAKPFNAEDLITSVRTAGDDAKRLCSEYLEQFSKIRSTDAYDKRYCDLVNDTLQLLFHPDLVNPESAKISPNTTPASRLIFRNQARDHRFWIDAKDIHKSKYLTFDIYNKHLEPDHIKILASYLSDTHGQMGVILGRASDPDSLRTVSVAVFENEEKIIFTLDDTHLKAMLEDKAGGVNPAYELEKLYQKIIADARN